MLLLFRIANWSAFCLRNLLEDELNVPKIMSHFVLLSELAERPLAERLVHLS